MEKRKKYIFVLGFNVCWNNLKIFSWFPVKRLLHGYYPLLLDIYYFWRKAEAKK